MCLQDIACHRVVPKQSNLCDFLSICAFDRLSLLKLELWFLFLSTYFLSLVYVTYVPFQINEVKMMITREVSDFVDKCRSPDRGCSVSQ